MTHKEEGKVPQDVIEAIGSRFKFYLDREWRGNQSALSEELAISQPAISRVAAGEQLPSGKLLLALREQTNLNLDWLLSERGPMLLGEEGMAGAGGPKVPVANQPLPGAPAEYPTLLSGDLIPGYGIVRPTQYWLRVQYNDPITRASIQKIQVRDLVLLETNREFFPEPLRVYEDLWVVRITEKKEIKYRLAEVSYSESGIYYADTFDLKVIYPQSQEDVPKRKKATGKRGRLSPRTPIQRDRLPHRIRSNDLVARRVVILRR